MSKSNGKFELLLTAACIPVGFLVAVGVGVLVSPPTSTADAADVPPHHEIQEPLAVAPELGETGAAWRMVGRDMAHGFLDVVRERVPELRDRIRKREE